MPALEQDVAALLSDLVAIPSINPAFRMQGDPEHWFGETSLGAHVADWLRRIGLQVEVDPVAPGRANVIARFRGRTRQRNLLWEGHLDTVHVAGMTVDPFRASVRSGKLFGRGAVDDKGCLVAFMLALRDLVRSPPDCDITFVAAIDEEYQFRGIQHFLGRKESFDFGVAGEPTDLKIVRACKGCVRWEVDVIGKAAHSSKPAEGIDAIALATDLLRHLRETATDRPGHPLLGKPTLTCTMLQAGQGPNVVAGKAKLTFDCRTLPDETGAAAWASNERIIRAFSRTLPEGATAVIHPALLDSTSMEVPEDADVVALMQQVCETFGVASQPEGVPYGSDASKMTQAGIPTIIFGPGNIDQAHTADEFVVIAEVARAADMLAAFARGCHSVAGAGRTPSQS